jgi:hypothetical protein
MIGIQATSIHGMYHQQCEWCCCVGEMDGGERERDSQLGCFCTGCQLPLQDTISFTLALPVFPHRMYSRTCEGFADPGWNSSNSSHESQVNSSHGDWFQPPHWPLSHSQLQKLWPSKAHTMLLGGQITPDYLTSIPISITSLFPFPFPYSDRLLDWTFLLISLV